MTIATARFLMTHELYREQHSEWVKSVSRWRKWAVPFAIANSAIGLLLLYIGGEMAPGLFRIALFLTAMGPVIYIDDRLTTRKWLKRVTSSRVTGEAIEFRFEEDAIYVKGPTSESRTEWQGFQRAIESSKGLFIYTDPGFHYYIPDSALDPSGTKQAIINRLQAAQ